MNKVKFKDLNGWLKFAFIWVMIGVSLTVLTLLFWILFIFILIF